MCKVTTREAFLRACWQHLPKESVCVELGVLDGDFSRMILGILKPKYLTLIDPFIVNSDVCYGAELQYSPVVYSTETQYENILHKFISEIYAGTVNVQRKYSTEAVKEMPDSIFDFIYIDASHLYEDVKRDLNDWLPKLKPKGLMCLHDYIEYDRFGVIQATTEFCKENNFEEIIFNENGGDIALKRK